ncbi:hypothetical protein BDR26DRAFT_405334 [Obelidium mucronatum]|nr:hypothetical protein BDR26DRAFT_405334 [Obelidium mucronatum]
MTTLRNWNLNVRLNSKKENAYKPPLVLSQQQHQINMAYDLPDQMIVKHIQGKPIVLQPSNPPSRSASAHKFKHPTRYRENTTNNKNTSLALSTQNIEIINTWLKEEGKPSQPTQKRTTTRPLPKHLHKHLPLSNLNKQAGSGSGGGTSYSNTMFSKSVAASSSNAEFFPVRQTLAQRNAILRKTKEAAAAAMLNNIQTQDIPTCAFDLTPMEQLEKAVDSARPYNMPCKECRGCWRWRNQD